MNRATLRVAIVVLTLITAGIHLFLGIRFSDILFLLNAIGYAVLLVALLRPFSFLSGQENLVHYAFMAFAAVTIIAWLVMNGDFSDPLGVGTKIDEILLIVALWLHRSAAA